MTRVLSGRPLVFAVGTSTVICTMTARPPRYSTAFSTPASRFRFLWRSFTTSRWCCSESKAMLYPWQTSADGRARRCAPSRPPHGSKPASRWAVAVAPQRRSCSSRRFFWWWQSRRRAISACRHEWPSLSYGGCVRVPLTNAPAIALQSLRLCPSSGHQNLADHASSRSHRQAYRTGLTYLWLCNLVYLIGEVNVCPLAPGSGSFSSAD